jgi:energy-coupling factor transporter ATP-binding protein EcfA2
MIESKDYISSFELLDTFGTKHVRVEPKSIVKVVGHNASGKSSIIRGLLSVFAGGSDPSIIRKGTQKSVVSIDLASGVKITKTTAITKKGSVRTDLEILDPAGNPVPAPQSYVSQLSESIAVDPGSILRIDATTAAGKKALAEILMRLMPIEFDAAEIGAAAQYQAAKAKPGKVSELTGSKWIESLTPACALASVESQGLGGLKKTIESIRDQRRRVGIQAEEAGGTVSQLTQSLPADEGTDYTAALAESEEERKSVEQQVAALKQEVAETKTAALDAASSNWREHVDRFNTEIDAKIKALEAERQQRNDAARDVFDAEKDNINAMSQANLAAIGAEARPLLDQITARVAELKAGADSQKRVELTRGQVEQFTAKQLEASHRYTELSKVIERLEDLKKSKLDALPVAGLEVSDGQVLIDGIEWQNVNTARRVEIAMQVCALCSGSLAFMVLDDVGHLDTETRAALEEAIVGAGYQLIEAMVADCPLRIEAPAASREKGAI